MTTATIDGQVLEVQTGETILEAARRVGVSIPTLCYMEGLPPEGGCRMCLVEVEGARRPVGACYTMLRPGMQVITASPALRDLRREVLALSLDEYTAPSTDRDDVFTHLLERFGLEVPIAPNGDRSVDRSHPYLRFDPGLCITCRRCLHACEAIQGQFVYGLGGRGPSTHLLFGRSVIFAKSPCVACGACVEVCPTGALTDRDREEAVPADTVTQSVCGYCGVGCRIEVASAAGHVVRIRGVEEAAVNRGHLCVKGRYAHAYHHSPDRLTQPLVRTANGHVPISWDDALVLLADRLRSLRDAHGPDALGAFTSSRSTNEAAYLLQKLFRTVVGTNNVDCCARVCHSSTALALRTVTGTGAASASYTDIDRATCIVIAGANPTEAHPVVGARIKQAVLRGAKLVVIDPRRIELADYADVHLPLVPGTNVALFNALAKLLVDNGYVDEAYVRERVEGYDALRLFLHEVALDEVVEATGVEASLIREAADVIGRCGPVLFVHGLGLSELTQGTASVMTLCNLGMLTGSIGRLGAGMLPLRGQNNVQGNADMGSMPNLFTGYQPVGDPEVRAHVEAIWGTLPPSAPGLTIPEMINAASRGEVRALWIQGEDVVQSDPNETHVRTALDALDFLIVQELFFTETARYADLVLPAAGALEQEGTFTNGERRIQHVRPAVPPPGQARPDWIVIRDAARAMGAAWDYPTPATVMDEVARVASKLFGGVRYDRLDPDGLQWPCSSTDHPGTTTVHADGFLRGKGRLVTIDYVPSPEHGVAGYPYLLVTGRVLDHYNVGTMTRRTPQQELVPGDVLVIHPEDAGREDVRDGDAVEVESRWGRTVVPVRRSERVVPGTLFLSFHFPESHTNRLTGPHLDPEAKCPQYKATAVRLNRVPAGSA